MREAPPSMPSSCRPTVAEIDLSACVHNLRRLRNKVSAIDVWPVLKADAYGHGAVAVANALCTEPIAGFCVATASEGRQLRQAGIKVPILVMAGLAISTPEDAFRMVVEYGLAAGIQDATVGDRLANTVRELGIGPASVHLKVDTGMGRLGIDPGQVTHLARFLAGEPSLSFDGLFSTLASSDSFAEADPGTDLVRQQIEIFLQVCATLQQNDILPVHRTLANSAGLMHHPESWRGAMFSGVRPGLAIYGASLTPGKGIVDLCPAMRLVTRVMAIRHLPKGVTVGYGMTATTYKGTRIGVLPLGYHDGLPRTLSNRGSVLIGNHRAPIIGRVSMDLTLVDITGVPTARVGDEVVVFGSTERSAGSINEFEVGSVGHSENLPIVVAAADRAADEAIAKAPPAPAETDSRACISVEEVSEWAETIPHEILSGIGSRVPRCYSTSVGDNAAEA